MIKKAPRPDFDTDEFTKPNEHGFSVPCIYTDENGAVTRLEHKDIVIIPNLEHLDVILPNSDTDDFKCTLKTCEIKNTDTPVWQQYQEWFDSFIKEEYENSSTRLTPEENKSFLSLLTLLRDENVRKFKPSEGE